MHFDGLQPDEEDDDAGPVQKWKEEKAMEGMFSNVGGRRR